VNYRIVHRTVYEYSDPVTVSHHAARVKPRLTALQRQEEFSLRIDPEPAVRNMRTDYFGNRVCFFSLQQIHSRLELIATSRVSVTAETPLAPALSPVWTEVTGVFQDPVSPDVVEPYQFVFDSTLVRATPDLAAYARESFDGQTPLLVGAADLTRRIYEDFTYDATATTVATPLEEVLEKRRGVCQDFAHLGIACLRSLGIPARYVSGYLRTRPAEGGERLMGADASHAWFSVFCPNHGWVDFDPTNNLLPGTEHIVVAFGRDFNDVSPVSGILVGGGEHRVDVGVDVDVEQTPVPGASAS
jgi:transglutaminase-like putative cysteine protease